MKRHIKELLQVWLEMNKLEVREEYIDALADTMHVMVYTYYNDSDKKKREWNAKGGRGNDTKEL